MDSRREDELVRRGAELDGVELVEDEPRHRPDSAEDKRARRRVLAAWALATVSGLGAIVVFLAWPWRYVPPDEEGSGLYALYTPVFGLFLGLTVLGVSAALILTVREQVPRETAVQQRHRKDGSSEEDRETFTAILADTARRTGLKRRSVFGRAAAAAIGVLGTTTGVIGVGAFVRDPWDGESHGSGPRDTLWHTGWAPLDGETVYLRTDTGEPHEVKLVRPEDLEPGSSIAVFPFRESERDDPQALAAALERSDNPATLFRLPEGTRVAERPERAGLNHGSFYAYSRLCTHLGCPASMHEAQENLVLCPCHQSQFDLTDYATPVFGPAARPLPQLPITVDAEGYFVATGDFTAAVGPGFWEDG